MVILSENLINRIDELKRQRNAVILVHNYQPGEIQDIGDHVGDSLGLSRTAAEVDAEVIVFCGVHFMAETASIISPEKTVLLPDENAGCPMANMVTPRELEAFKQQHPGAAVVTYVNSSAAVKAMSDICCTSANAVEVVRGIDPDREVIFVPDRNLGSFVASKLGRELILWNGFCPTHERILPEAVAAMRDKYPRAELVVHPECRPAVVAMADVVASTTGILNHCRESEVQEFIIGTEIGILHRMRKENPKKSFYPACVTSDCPNMKLSSLEKVVWCLEDMAPEVRVEPGISEKARAPIEKMLEVLAGA